MAGKVPETFYLCIALSVDLIRAVFLWFFIVERNIFLHTLLYLCANIGLKISHLVAVETTVLVENRTFKRGVA